MTMARSKTRILTILVILSVCSLGIGIAAWSHLTSETVLSAASLTIGPQGAVLTPPRRITNRDSVLRLSLEESCSNNTTPPFPWVAFDPQIELFDGTLVKLRGSVLTERGEQCEVSGLRVETALDRPDHEVLLAFDAPEGARIVEIRLAADKPLVCTSVTWEKCPSTEECSPVHVIYWEIARLLGLM